MHVCISVSPTPMYIQTKTNVSQHFPFPFRKYTQTSSDICVWKMHYSSSSFVMTGKINRFTVLCSQCLSTVKKEVPLTFTVFLINITIFIHFPDLFVSSNMLGNSFIFYFAFLSHKNTIKIHQCDTETRGDDPQQDCLFPSQTAKRAIPMSKHAMDGIAKYRWVDKLTNWQSWWFNNWFSPSNFGFLPRWDFGGPVGGYPQLTNLSLGLSHLLSIAIIHHVQAWDRGLRT